MDESGKRNYRMGGQQIINILFVAGFADALTLIPFVGDFVGPVFWFLFALYLWLKGFGFLRPKRLVTSLSSTILEILPGFQALPTILVGAIIIILLIRVEDKTGLSLTGKDAASNISNIKNNAKQMKISGRGLAKYTGRQIGARAGGAIGGKIAGSTGESLGRAAGGSLGGRYISSRTGHPVERKSSKTPASPNQEIEDPAA